MSLGCGSSDAAGIAAIGSGMRYVRFGTGKSAAADAGVCKGEGIVGDFGGLINLFDLFVRRRFDGIDMVSAKQVDDQSIKILGSGPDDDLLCVDPDTAISRKIMLNGLTKFGASAVG